MSAREPATNARTHVGRHRLICGDITALTPEHPNGPVGALMGDDLADVVYSDPPWGPGNQKYWHTHRAHGAVPRTSWPDFLSAFCVLVATYKKPNAPAFIEMGLRWVEDLERAMSAAGLSHRKTWRIFYGPRTKPLPNALLQFGPAPLIRLPDPPVGEPVTRAALEAVVRPGSLVLDPCTGLGMTARITHILGGQFRGCEMNPLRLARTEAWLRKRV